MNHCSPRLGIPSDSIKNEHALALWCNARGVTAGGFQALAWVAACAAMTDFVGSSAPGYRSRARHKQPYPRTASRRGYGMHSQSRIVAAAAFRVSHGAANCGVSDAASSAAVPCREPSRRADQPTATRLISCRRGFKSVSPTQRAPTRWTKLKAHLARLRSVPGVFHHPTKSRGTTSSAYSDKLSSACE